ncbi:hypothetical protein ACSSV1_003647 [Labrenzia sp. MBR-25]
MPHLQWTAFKREIEALQDIYRQDNRWVGWWRHASWNNECVMPAYIRAAYRLYDATARNELEFIVLGGTSIRMARDLIFAFGITGLNGIQDAPTVVAAREAQAAREAPRPTVDRNGMPVPPPANPDNRVVPVNGVGSILSEDRWTPILNDALIVGSATAQHDFVIALDHYEQGIWRECEASLKPDLARLHARYAGRFNGNPPESFLKNTEEYTLMVWQRFFSWNMQMFWDTKLNIPRVLTRELLGLSMFGYEVKLGDKQIGFSPNTNAPDPTFTAYVNGLRTLRFHDSAARSRIMQTISTYLLGNNHAIGFTADQHTVRTPPITGGQPMQLV